MSIIDNIGELVLTYRQYLNDTVELETGYAMSKDISQLTMADALTVPPLDRAEILAGSEGLDRLVTFVTVMEVPEMADLVQSGELLLTSGYPLRDKPEKLLELVPRLVEKDLAGLGVKPTNLNPIPDEMIQAAEESHFPLLRLPVDLVLDEIIQPVMKAVLNRQMAMLEFSDKVRRSLTRLVLQGLGLREVAYALAEMIGNPVAIVDISGELLACDPSPLKSREYPYLIDERFEQTNNSLKLRERVSLPTMPGADEQGANTWQIVTLPNGSLVRELRRLVHVGNDLYGHILIWETNQALNDLDLQAVARAGTVAALDITRQSAVEAAERRYQSEFLEEILFGEAKDRDTALQRARLFGWDFSEPHTVAILDIDDFYQTYTLEETKSGEEQSRPLLESFRMVTRSVSHMLDDRIVVSPHNDSIILIVPSAPNVPFNSVRNIVDSILNNVRQTFEKLSISAGIGLTRDDFLELNQSYIEGRGALDLGHELWGPGGIYSFDELGVYRLVFNMDRTLLQEFHEKELGALLDYDKRRGTELLQTLEAVLGHNLRLNEAADTLRIHYNTLKYRLERIEQLCGDFRRDAHRRLSLEMSLKAYRVLHRERRD